MEQKIFKKSNKPKIKLNLNLQQYSWWLRSAFNYYGDTICFINFYGYIDYMSLVCNYNCDILPVCII